MAHTSSTSEHGTAKRLHTFYPGTCEKMTCRPGKCRAKGTGGWTRFLAAESGRCGGRGPMVFGSASSPVSLCQYGIVPWEPTLPRLAAPRREAQRRESDG